jgi:magnesium-protoporphyrin O-methyltransferase
VSGCCGNGIPACEEVFDEGVARDEAAKFRRDGPGWSTRELIDGLAAGIALDGSSVIDIGAGVGAVHLGLLTRGAARAVDLDGSSAYVAAAAGEAKRLGFEDRVEHVLGDAVVLGPTLEPADLVALDRVICCSGDVAGLLGTAALLARQRIGLVYPRDSWWIRAGTTVANPVFFARSGGFRFRVHRQATVAALLGAAGFAPLAARNGRLWRIETWERTAGGVSPRPSPAAAAPYPSG